MSSMVCLEPPTKTIASSNSHFDSDTDTDEGINESPKSDGDLGGWSFIQALTNTTCHHKPYVHPLSKHSSSSQLSTRSLELCTETLGSETGSDTGDDIDFSLSSSDSESSKSPTKQGSRQLCSSTFKKANNYACLPPPLTSISASGSNCYSIKPHREGGRLVMKAVLVPSPNTSCFQAERRDGRLKLRYIKNSSDHCEQQQVEEDNLDEDRDGNSGNVGGESGIGKIQRPSTRCKEGGRGNKGLLIWKKPFLVAT